MRGSSARAIAGVCGVALLAGSGCARGNAGRRETPRGRSVEASPFVCEGALCTQRHVRLPDDGEWLCAEREGVVWCAGGEPAAGVVSASVARGYRCGERRGGERRERVCVDVAPDYPDGGAPSYRCRFEQEHGVVRSCTRAAGTPRPWPAGAAPNCWVDADCAGRCERGSCVESG